jgi:hypothetical protein
MKPKKSINHESWSTSFSFVSPRLNLQIGKLRPAPVVAIAPGRYADVLLALISSRTHQAVPEFDELIDAV